MNEKSRILIQLIHAIEGQSSIFCCDEGSGSSEVMTYISDEMTDHLLLPVIRICWNEDDQTNNEENDKTVSFYPSRNFTSTLIRIERLLYKNKYLILISDLSILKYEQKDVPYIRFLSALLRKSEEYESSVLTTINKKDISQRMQSTLIPRFKNMFTLEEQRIRTDSCDLADITYDVKKDRLHLKPDHQDEMNKIKEIFSLTPEEKKELDRIVGQSIEEYRTSM